jgi:hypothetical protein
MFARIQSWSWVLVAHTCNPSYSGGGDLEDVLRRQLEQIVCETLSQKSLHIHTHNNENRAGGVA